MMSVTLMVSRSTLEELQHVIEANPLVDWRAIALDQPGLDALEWCALERETLAPLLKAYQRLLRILPPAEERRALPLLESGLHSAIQIADLPQDEFLRRWAALFPGEEALGFAVHRTALRRRGDLLLHHINNVQSNEPHYRAARFK
jgi:hypothetical protein